MSLVSRPLDFPRVTPQEPFRIAHISDIHCGGAHFVPSLMDRAIAEINEMEPEHRRLLRRPDDLRLQAGVLRGEALPGQDRVRGARGASRATTTRATSATSTSRSCSATATRCCASAASRSSPSTRRSPTSTRARSAAAATAGSRSSSPGSKGLRIFVMHHHLLPIPGTGRERNIVFDAGDAIECLQRSRRRPGARRPQARAVRVAARGPLRRQHRHGLDDAPARQHAALLQRRRDHRHARGRVAQVPVPRVRADHPVLDRDAGVREVHRPDRGRGHHAAPDGDARAGRHRRRALRARRARRARGAALRGRRRLARGRQREAAWAARTTASRLRQRSTRRSRWEPDLVYDLSDEPVLGPRERLALASRVLAHGVPTRAPTSASSRPSSPRSACRRSRSRHRQARREDGRDRARRTAARARPARRRRRDGPGRPARAGARRGAPRPRVAARAHARGPARGLRPPRDGRAHRRADRRLPPLRRRARGRAWRPRTCSRASRSRSASTRSCCSSTAAARRCRRSRPTRACSSSPRTRRRSSPPAT